MPAQHVPDSDVQARANTLVLVELMKLLMEKQVVNREDLKLMLAGLGNQIHEGDEAMGVRNGMADVVELITSGLYQ